MTRNDGTPGQGWAHTDEGLALLIDGHPTPIPSDLAALLIGADGVGLSPVAAVDILALETRLRHQVAVATSDLAAAERQVHAARAAADTQPAPAHPGRHLGGGLREAIDQQTRARVALDQARLLLGDLRRTITAACPRSGWLADAVAGWSRGPQPPNTATVFSSVADFLAADSRRAENAEGGGLRIAGVERWGRAWRRDGDDDSPLTAAPCGIEWDGPWALGYIAGTGELYAVRRSPHLTDEVWLLGPLMQTRESVRSLFSPLDRRMREPNSVVLAAERVAAAMRRGPGLDRGQDGWRELGELRGADLASRLAAGGRAGELLPDRRLNAPGPGAT